MRSPPRTGSVPQRLPRRDGSEAFRKGWVMQHSAVDLENYARLYTEDRLREAATRRRASEVVAAPSFLGRMVAQVQSWFVTAPGPDIVPSTPVAQPVHLVPRTVKPHAGAVNPYVGMVVIARDKRSCTLDAA